MPHVIGGSADDWLIKSRQSRLESGGRPGWRDINRADRGRAAYSRKFYIKMVAKVEATHPKYVDMVKVPSNPNQANR